MNVLDPDPDDDLGNIDWYNEQPGGAQAPVNVPPVAPGYVAPGYVAPVAPGPGLAPQGGGRKSRRFKKRATKGGRRSKRRNTKSKSRRKHRRYTLVVFIHFFVIQSS